MSDHWIIVTGSDDDHGFGFQCDGPDESCIPWIECREEHNFTDDEYDDGEGMSHGEWHQKWYFGWATRAETCALYEAQEAAMSSGSDLAHQLGNGKHEIDFEWDDEYTILVWQAREETK